MKVTLENLTKAFHKWNEESSTNNWAPRENKEENAAAQAEYLLELLKNNS